MNLDFAETFLDIAGVDDPADMQGRSLRAAAGRAKLPGLAQVGLLPLLRVSRAHSVARHYGVRTDRYKLIHFYELDEWELYDLEKDPNEMKNVYSDPLYRADCADDEAGARGTPPQVWRRWPTRRRRQLPGRRPGGIFKVVGAVRRRCRVYPHATHRPDKGPARSQPMNHRIDRRRFLQVTGTVTLGMGGGRQAAWGAPPASSWLTGPRTPRSSAGDSVVRPIASITTRSTMQSTRSAPLACARSKPIRGRSSAPARPTLSWGRRCRRPYAHRSRSGWPMPALRWPIMASAV